MIFQAIVAAGIAALQAGGESEVGREGCRRSTLLCLDADGLPLAGDTLPPTVASGARIDIKVIGCRRKDAVFRLVDEVVEDLDRILREPSSGAGEPGRQGTKSLCAPELLATARLTVPTDARARTFTVLFAREGPPRADGTRTLERLESYSAAIVHGRYYIDIGVLFPLVVGGARRVVAEDTDTPGTTRLRVREDLDVFPALMLNVFPGGRDLAAINSFAVGGACLESSRFVRPSRCHAARHRRRAANSLGLQFGVELDLRRRDRLFFGGLFEPVSGLSLGAGLAITRLEHIRPGHADGDEVPTPMTVTPEGEVDLSKYTERLWVPRFYIGVTLSLGVVRAIRSIIERRRGAGDAPFE